jgi:signal transduction histidine kinase
MELGALLFFVLMYVPMVTAIVAAANLTEGHAFAPRMAWIAVAVLAGAAFHPLALPLEQLLALAVQSWFGVAARAPDVRPGHADYYPVAFAIRGALWGALLAAVVLARRRQHRVVRAEREVQMRRLQAEQQEAEMRLLSLQAQVEPHFLFNTLAHVQRLRQVDPGRGRSMLHHLGEYMRSALPRMRGRESTLADELALVRAYVGVQQVRMGERLRAEIDVAPALLGARVPPMMLLILAENAVKHGIGPRRDGGTLCISAHRRPDNRLEVEVLDDGVGLRPAAGGGQGLANTRARLATLFGAAGALEIGNQDQGGVRAALLLPFVAGPAGVAAS